MTSSRATREISQGEIEDLRQEIAYHLSVFSAEGVMKRQIVLGTVVAFGAISLAAVAQQPPKPSAAGIDVEKLKDNLFVLKALTNGGGGNTSVFITTNGVVVIDTKNPGWGQPLLD